MSARTFPLRLRPGQDLRAALERLARTRGVRAGIVLSAVGSLEAPCIRFAGAQNPSALPGCFEIVSLTGTVCRDGVHLHAALAGAQGQVVGGGGPAEFNRTQADGECDRKEMSGRRETRR